MMHLQLLPNPQNKFVVVGEDVGRGHHYGHADILIGKFASHDVYPLIIEWLTDHEDPVV